MSYQITGNIQTTLAQPAASAGETVSLDQRLSAKNDDAQIPENISELYAYFKQLWQANPNMESVEIVKHLREFVAADKSKPFEKIPTQTGALAQVMQLVEKNEGKDAVIYPALRKAVCYAVASNGTYNDFLRKMMEPIEEQEPW